MPKIARSKASSRAQTVLATINAGPKPKIAKAAPVKERIVPKRGAEVKLIPRYFVEPVHTSRPDPTEGGAHMYVVIGPGQGEIGMYGSTPLPNTPATMRALLDRDRHLRAFGWVAGHLLNDNLGGPGIAINLTPLTTAGNKNHLNAIETTIKNTIDKCYSRVVNYRKDRYYYGVEYEVTVADSPWPNMREFVTTHLLVSAKVVRADKTTGIVEDCPDSDPDAQRLYFAPVVDVVVDNTGYTAVPALTGSAPTSTSTATASSTPGV
jgi:hypothetical protein